MRTESGANETQRPQRGASRGAAADRDRGLLRIGRVNRWMVAGAIGMTGFLTSVAALAHPGSSRRHPQASSAGTTPQTSPNNATQSSGSNDPNAASNDPNAGAVDQNGVPVDPNAGQSAVPSDPSEGQPVAPSAAPQADPNAGLPPAATSGGS